MAYTENVEELNQSDLSSTQISSTEDCGYTEIEIAKVGDYTGSDQNGDPVPQHFTEDALKKIVDESEGKEYLLDQQHKSMIKGLDRDDSAAGWIKALSFKNGSIFGKVFWTKLGRSLVDSKIMRYISPVFTLSKDGVPQSLVNAALVNTPAISDIKPVINQASQIESLTKEITDMTKDEIIELIKQTVLEMRKEAVEKKAEEIKKEESAEQPTEKTETVEKTEEVANEDPEKKDQTATEPEKKADQPTEEKKEEVIKIESLNSAPAPTITADESWKNLHGEAFFDYLRKHPELH